MECSWDSCHLLAMPCVGIVVFICMRMQCRQNENRPRGTIHMGYAFSLFLTYAAPSVHPTNVAGWQRDATH